MSKFNKKSGNPQFRSSPHKLSPNTRIELLSLLGIDSNNPDDQERATEAIQRVEGLLGMYQPAVEALKDLPDPGEFVSAMSKLQSRTSRLNESLAEMHPRIRKAVEIGGADLTALERELSNLQVAAGYVKESSKNHKGRPKAEVFAIVVGQIRRVFRQYYGEVENTRKIRGAMRSLSQAENDEQEFIKFALEDAKIPHPKKIRRVYDRIGTPLADRNEAIKKIEAEAERRRRNLQSSEDAPEK